MGVPKSPGSLEYFQHRRGGVCTGEYQSHLKISGAIQPLLGGYSNDYYYGRRRNDYGKILSNEKHFQIQTGQGSVGE